MKGQVTADPLPSRPPCSAAEERELRAIARDLLDEALALGAAASEFRGHRIRVDCWFTREGLAVRCTLDGQVMFQACPRALWIKDLQANSGPAEASSRQVERELQFVFQGHPRQAW